MSAPNQKHPYYDEHIDDWQLMRHCASGEREVKEQQKLYLPMPSGFTTQKDKGVEAYAAYQLRAQYPDIVQPTLQGMVGVIHRLEAKIEGLEEGKPLEPLWEKCSKDQLTLEAFHRLITSEILLMGRYAVLTDVASEAKPDNLPYFAGYTAEQLINWDNPDRSMFVLDESTLARDNIDVDPYSWIDELRYRSLLLKDGKYTVQTFAKNNLEATDPITPQLRGGKPMTEIPLVVAGPRHLNLAIEPPPLIGVAKAALAIYRLDADYRHQLFNTGQETLFIIGDVETLPQIVGAGAIIGLPPSSEVTYVGPTGVGIAAHRTAIMDERQNAVAAGVRLFDNQKQAESGDALRLRASAQTATLTTIALASAAVLEKALRYAAMFVGQDPNQIVVKPNLKFVDTVMTASDALNLVKIWQSGAMSKTSLFEDLQRGEIISTERDFDEEEELIKKEVIDNPQPGMPGANPQLMPPGGPGSPNPRLNGNTPPSNIPSRFVETGQGLTVESQ